MRRRLGFAGGGTQAPGTDDELARKALRQDSDPIEAGTKAGKLGRRVDVPVYLQIKKRGSTNHLTGVGYVFGA